jgi:hypothetical protein
MFISVRQVQASLLTFRKMLVWPNIQTGVSSLASCPQLPIHNISAAILHTCRAVYYVSSFVSHARSDLYLWGAMGATMRS